jgi:hypothetical protein
MMERLSTLGLAVLAVLLGYAPTTRAQTAVENLYADLSKLPAAERQRRLEDGARKERKLVLIHTMRGSQSLNHVDVFKKRYPFLRSNSKGTSARRTPWNGSMPRRRRAGT